MPRPKSKSSLWSLVFLPSLCTEYQKFPPLSSPKATLGARIHDTREPLPLSPLLPLPFFCEKYPSWSEKRGAPNVGSILEGKSNAKAFQRGALSVVQPVLYRALCMTVLERCLRSGETAVWKGLPPFYCGARGRARLLSPDPPRPPLMLARSTAAAKKRLHSSIFTT